MTRITIHIRQKLLRDIIFIHDKKSHFDSKSHFIIYPF